MQYTPYDEWAGLIGDRYALREVIGLGGMGEVWSADDLILHRRVAVKLMHTQLAFDDVAQSRFQREVRAAASLNHPCVAAVHDAGWLPTVPPRPFLVMEHVSGHTAAERLRSDPPSPQEAVDWAAGTLEALACAHAAGLVHRDIKPANVMITTDGLVKVMDFGIAHIADGHDMSVTGTGDTVGTTAYMSPEQAQGLPVDARSDLYSTGCMLYELLTGHQPYVGDSPFAIAYQHISAAVPSPGDIGVQLPPHIEAALARAMAKNPDDRFADAVAMRGALVAPGGHDLPPSRPATLIGSPALPEEQATTVLTPPDRPRGLRWMALAALAVLSAGAVAAAVMAAAPDATRATGPTAQSSPSTADTSPRPEPSAGRSESTHAGRSAGPSASPHTSTDPHASTNPVPTVVVPADVVGKTLAQARADLAELGLNIALTPSSSGTSTSTVTATVPTAGTQLSRGDTVLLATRTDAEASATPRTTSSSSAGSGTASSSPSASASPTTTATAGTGPVIPPPPIHR